MIQPSNFWDHYCRDGKPLLLKGAARNMPAMTKWTDEYLLAMYGNLRVSCNFQMLVCLNVLNTFAARQCSL